MSKETQEHLALTTGCDRPYQHALTWFVSSYPWSEFVNHAHGFVPDGQAGRHGILATNDVNIGAADGREPHLDHGFPRTSLA